ncbi:MAG TPA: DegT/DnrJ/EryC1/StrS family aminotransferase [Candidatus Binataceae bacterium]|nr:DegT/DnrJ/EryC1/StrS family aminotransferase [Candidatus Binataceae bacterium]
MTSPHDPPLRMLMPFVDLRAQFAAIRPEVIAAVAAVMERQQFILGPEVERFEQEIADYVGAGAAVGCASGTDALLLVLMALGIGPGDEVITTPFTFIATAAAIARAGAKPVFADIDPHTFNIDPKSIETAITQSTRAIIAVHLFGLPADLAPIAALAKARSIAIVEDAAQAIGARYQGQRVGAIGDLGCFSFFPSKNLGGAGDGGLVTTSHPETAERIRVLREHGSRDKYTYETLGLNSRLDEIQAAVLGVKLKYLDQWNARRRDKADRYRAMFAERGLESFIELPVEPPGCQHVYNQFVIRCPRRDDLRGFLAGRGIPTQVYYPAPLHLQPPFANQDFGEGRFPQAERASREVLALPIYPELTDELQLAVVDSIHRFRTLI